MIALTRRFGRYGYRRVAALLRDAGWHVNDKRVERLWRREGLKVPQRQPKRGRLWLNDGSCIRLRPEYPGHVWAYDFVEGHRAIPARENGVCLFGHEFLFLSGITEGPLYPARGEGP